GQDLLRVPQRQSHLLVQNRRQGQRLRPQLHAADSHRSGGLQAMASLDPPLALAAAAHGDIETAHYGSPDNFFLILCFATFRFHAAAAMRAVLRQWNRDPFIHPRWNGAARLSTIALARLAARPLWVGFRVTPRMRRALTLASAQRGFQLPA